MRKALVSILLILFFFAGCRSPVPVNILTTGPPESTAAPTIAERTTVLITVETDSTVTATEGTTPSKSTDPEIPETTVPVSVRANISAEITISGNIPTETDPTEKFPTETEMPTKPALSTSPSPTSPLEPLPPTKDSPADDAPSAESLATRDAETVENQTKTDPNQKQTEPTIPIQEQIDLEAIEFYAETYAESIGFVVDGSLGNGNSGYYPPDYRIFTSMKEHCNAAIGLVSATKNQLNSRYSTVYNDVLIEKFYGLARINCEVVYSHTDELGGWYYIYVYYG